MRFVLGPPPDSVTPDDLAGGEWHRLRELPQWAFQLAALPIGAAFAFVLFVAWVVFTPDFTVEFAESAPVVAVTLAILSLGTLLQLAALPAMGLSRQAVLGLWPSRLLLYTSYACRLARRRHLLRLLLPFVVMALGPLFVVLVFRVQSGWLIFVSCVSALSFGAHVVQALWVAVQVPANAQIGGVRFQTYWRART